MPFASLARSQIIGPVIGIAAVAVAAFTAVPAFAQSAAQWPDRPVRLLVTVGAGGAADTLSRNLSNGFAQFANGQPLIVENRPGAGGTIAAAAGRARSRTATRCSWPRSGPTPCPTR